MRGSGPVTNDTPIVLMIVGGLLAGSALVYMSGGARTSVSYIQLVPILIAAARFRTIGGGVTGLAAALLVGFLVPHDVASGLDQTPVDWGLRLAMFVGLGAFAGWQFERVARHRVAGEAALRRDSGSGLPNQAALEQDLEHILQLPAGADDGPIHDTCLILLRLTDLFETLDAVGDDADDDIVRAVAARLIERVTWVDRVYRFNDAELAIIHRFHDLGDAEEQLRCRAEELRSAAQKSLPVRQVPLRLEVAIGLEVARGSDIGHVHGLIRRAQFALRAAEATERHHVIYDDSLEFRQVDGIPLMAQVEQSLADGRFQLHFQPQVRLDDGATIGVEALLRWFDEDGSMIPPATFMPKVERTSLVEPLERFVARSAVDFVARWDGRSVAINVSPRTLHDEEFLVGLIRLLDRRCLARERVEIEINVDSLFPDLIAFEPRLQHLCDAGLAIYLDDFGGERSSLAALYRLPCAGVKLDQSLVQAAVHDRRAAMVLRSIARVGAELGIRVAAKGIETDEQAQCAARLGCVVGQGYALGGPMQERDLIEWLKPRAR